MPTRPAAFRPSHMQTRKQVRREADQRRQTAHQRGYDRRWSKARVLYLAHHPLCAHCEEQDRIVAATVVDHIIPHRGDRALFWDTDNWQALCKTCHDRWKQREDIAAKSAEVRTRTHPVLAPSRIPLTLVCGPPGSGKSTHVARSKGPIDLVIDLDVIRSTLSGTPLHEPSPAFTSAALNERNRLLASLATDRTHERAWFIVSAPEASEREMWQTKLGAAEVVLMPTPKAECLRRIKADPSRDGQHERMASLVASWFRRAAA